MEDGRTRLHIQIHLYTHKDSLKVQKHKKLRCGVSLGVRELGQMGDKDGREIFHYLSLNHFFLNHVNI